MKHIPFPRIGDLTIEKISHHLIRKTRFKRATNLFGTHFLVVLGWIQLVGTSGWT